MEEALHGRCMECHSVSSDALEPAMPVICIDCHKPDPSMITHPEVGPVLFSHKRHAEYAEWTCIDCHHTDVPGEPHIACYRCHAADHFQDMPTLAEAMQKNCLDCHVEKEAGLTTWASFLSPREDMGLYRYEDEEGAFWWDHRFHAVGLSLSCRDCHHNTIVKDGVYVTAERAGKPWDQKAGAIQTCKSCHGPEGPVAGSVAEGTIAGTLKEAYQKSCIECHVRMEAGPLKWKALYELYEDQDEW
jgi:hypothetical protein